MITKPRYPSETFLRRNIFPHLIISCLRINKASLKYTKAFFTFNHKQILLFPEIYLSLIKSEAKASNGNQPSGRGRNFSRKSRDRKKAPREIIRLYESAAATLINGKRHENPIGKDPHQFFRCRPPFVGCRDRIV